MRALLDNNSIPEEILKAFNRDYRSTFLTTGIFFIPAGIFPTTAWCHHIFLEGERAATLILARESEDYFSGARHCYEQFVPFVQEWIEVNRSEDFAYHLTASFARLLDGNMDSLRTVARGLAQRGWTPDSSKSSSLQQRFHHRFTLMLSFPSMYPESIQDFTESHFKRKSLFCAIWN